MHWVRGIATKKNGYCLLCLSFIVAVVIFNVSPKSSGTARMSDTSTLSNNFQSILNANKNIKTILLWNSFFEEKHFKFGIGQDAFKRAGCPVTNCAIWDQEDGNTSLPHGSFDAVVFHVVDFMRDVQNKVPPVRHPSQLYTFMLLESPATNKFNLLPYKEMFNLTMTYRRDSDIYAPYGWISSKSPVQEMYPSKVPTEWMVPSYENMEIPLRWKLKTKKKAVAWIVSNCRTPSKREEYVKELSRHIGVDIYGKCGLLKCDKKSSVECYKRVEKTYMFYLSFENSLCMDYVTEKFFDILEIDVVPVVHGSAEYDKIAPPMSYINAKDYSSPKELADYLKYLRKTPEEYEKYFWWKQHYRVVSNTYAVMFCSLCEILNSAPVQRMHEDIGLWWNAPDVCYSPKDEIVWTELQKENGSSFFLDAMTILFPFNLS